jgi:hypothetical protein
MTDMVTHMRKYEEDVCAVIHYSVLQNKVLIEQRTSPMIIDVCRFSIGSDFCKTLYVVVSYASD